MTTSNDSTATLGTIEPVIAKDDARGIIEAKRKAGGSTDQYLPANPQPTKSKAVAVAGGATVTTIAGRPVKVTKF